MAKGLLFALVRKGSKLNYLDDTRELSVRKRKLTSHEKLNSRFKEEAHTGNDACEREGDTIRSVESLVTSDRTRRKRGKNLLDLTLLKLSKGGKVHRDQSARSTDNKTANVRHERDWKSDCLITPTIRASVASGYFLDQPNSISASNSGKELEKSKKQDDSTRNIPRIVFTEKSTKSVISGKSVNNRPRVSSFPQLRVPQVDERSRSWSSGSSLVGSRDGYATRPNSTTEETERQSLFIEASSAFSSPSFQRRYLGSAESASQILRDSSADPSRRNQTCPRLGSILPNPDKTDALVKRASSWGGGDKRDGSGFCIKKSSKIDVFLPSCS